MRNNGEEIRADIDVRAIRQSPRPGYRQTEVGVIPEDWDCIKSGEVVRYFGGNAFKQLGLSVYLYRADLIGIVQKYNEFDIGTMNVNEIELTIHDWYNRKKEVNRKFVL